MKENIYVCTTLRHLLFSLIISKKKSHETNHVIFCFDHQDVDKNAIDLKNNLDKNTFVYYINERDMIDDFVKGNFFSFSEFISRNVHLGLKGFLFPKRYIGKKIKNFKMNSSVYLYHNGTFLSKYFRCFNEVFLIEDGLVNYSTIEISNPVKKIIRFLTNRKSKYVMGEEDYIKKIYLMEPTRSHARVKFKVDHLKDLLGDIDVRETQRLHSIFKSPQIQDGTTFFLTQALDIAGLCSKKDKIDIYRRILNELKMKINDKIYIKIHPAESIQDYFPLEKEVENMEFIDSKIPFELLHLTCPNAKVYSLYSSGMSSMNMINGGGNLIVSVDVWRRFECSEIISESIIELHRLCKGN
ncbi:polysialyltransferase family glycosyltransferase [Aeromonas media]|uniref:polysialyltransferase family glycosyltransferase n=2 Tax=Aeromonas TaxID=642 RepID=UPI0038D05488